MSIETLLQAAWYVEQQELKEENETLASTSSSSDHSFAVAPHSNHHNSNEPRGAKMKRERTEPDDLLCEEQMLIIDEDPVEMNKINGNHSTTHRSSPVISRGPLMTQNNTTHTIIHHGSAQHHQIINQNNHNNTPHNTYVDNHNANHTQGSTRSISTEIDTTQDNKKHRNGPCVIRSGTREVHNKLEKNRRAHLKECFERLKEQLPPHEEKKSSNLYILHQAMKYIQELKRKENEYEHEMEKLAREKIASQQRIVALKKELSATWDHIDFSALLQEQQHQQQQQHQHQNSTVDSLVNRNVTESMEVDVGGLARGGTIYSSTSSLSSSSITASSPQNHQTSTTSSIHSQVATAAVVCQTQGLNLANNNTPTTTTTTNNNNINNNNSNNNNNNNNNLRESPPASSSPGASIPSIPSPVQEKVINPNVQQQSHQIHLPINAQVLNTTIMPALQHLGQGLRVDTRQLLVAHTTGTIQNSNDQSQQRLIAVQSNSTGETRPVALVVHSSATNDNRVTFVHSNLTNQDRPVALAVQSTSSNDVRPVTFVHSGNEGRPLMLATHPPPLNVTTAQTRLRSVDGQTTHKMLGGVTLVSGNGSELTRLPGGAELNILPGVFRSVKSQPLTVQGGLALSHSGLPFQSTGKTTSTVMQTTPSTDGGVAHIVTQNSQLTGLTPIVTPMTVVSQGNQVTAHIIAPSNLAGKMITTPILKSVGQVPLVNAQYLNTLVKPVVVVSTSSNSTLSSSSTSSSAIQTPSTQPSVTSHSNV